MLPDAVLATAAVAACPELPEPWSCPPAARVTLCSENFAQCHPPDIFARVAQSCFKAVMDDIDKSPATRVALCRTSYFAEVMQQELTGTMLMSSSSYRRCCLPGNFDHQRSYAVPGQVNAPKMPDGRSITRDPPAGHARECAGAAATDCSNNASPASSTR